MKHLKFRAWDDTLFRFFGHSTLEELCKNNFQGTNFYQLTWNQFSGLQDINGVDIFEGDVVSIAGYGDYEVEFPFLELYDAKTEGDIGKIIGNIYENPELIGS